MSEEITQKSAQELDAEFEVASLRTVEAALFLAGRFMTLQELITLTDINPVLLKKSLADLQDKYKESGISIIQQENMWKMDVAEDFVPMVNKLATGSSEFTKAEQETLAMIAYKQPIKQSVVIKIRGNKGYDHVKKFVDMGFILKKKVGHTAELSLSDKFYEYFHMSRGERLEEVEHAGSE